MLAGDPTGAFGPLYGRRLINLIGARHRKDIAESNLLLLGLHVCVSIGFAAFCLAHWIRSVASLGED